MKVKLTFLCSCALLASTLSHNFFLVFQFRALATDLGGVYSRNSSNQASIQVKVERNKNAPKFNNPTYTKRIPQTQNANSTLVSVRAQDTDSRVGFIAVMLNGGVHAIQM